ncbi:MAG: GNAT family N-acetyltransferase [Chloroflexi bacterium]|nr:GNAT family N-acetyltransferase [Chloroflexota bacterium]
MTLEIGQFSKSHLEAAARLVSLRYERLREQTPLLPKRYAEIETLSSLLNNLIESGRGVVALENGKLMGFLAAWQLVSFRGKRSVFSPEWANAVSEPNGRRVYETMYSCLAADWRADGYNSHLISLFANRHYDLECWQWLGFGPIAADAIRGLNSIQGSHCQVEIKQASLRDIEAVMALDDALRRHIASSPIFLTNDKRPERIYYEDWLQNPQKAIWLGCLGDAPIAFLRIGPANTDACTIIYADKTASITGAFTQVDVRGAGIATALLNHALEWARAQGYERCAVDFEPMNYWARRFWLRYFEPVCYTFIRHV